MTKGKDFIKNVVDKPPVSFKNECGTDKENMLKSKIPTPTSAQFKDTLTVPFKKPLGVVSTIKKIDFNHIRSPIGEYIKNTAKSPMIISAKSVSNDIMPTKLVFDRSHSTKKFDSSICTKSLPKKFYSSSKIKKVWVLLLVAILMS